MGFACSFRVQYEYSNRSFCWWQVVSTFKSYKLKQALQRDIGASQHTEERLCTSSSQAANAETRWGSMATHRRTACEHWLLMRRVAGTEPLVPAKVKASAGIK
jgi:hypothetical protein